MAKYENEIYAYALENAIEFGKTSPSIILPKLFQFGLKKEEIKEIMPKINQIVDEINSLDEKQKTIKLEYYKKYLKEKPKEKEGLKDLQNHLKKMVFRMAPFPSGSLHIGNTKTFLLNALYAEKYKAKILLVIDDTIGSDEKPISKDAYKLIPEAFDYLKVKYKKPIVYKSDRLKIYYKYAEKMIKKDKAYVCSCSQEILRENRVNQIECSCRQFEIKEQMKRCKQMFKAKQGEYIFRIVKCFRI